MGRVKEGLRIFKGDIKNNYKGILAIFLYWLVFTLLFHNFCPFVIGLGLPCPGCGMTRAAFSLLMLKPVQAWRYNPSIYLWLPLIIAYCIQRYIRLKPVKQLRIFLFLVALFTVAIYIWRLTHQFPSHTPMVYNPDNMLAKLVPLYGWLLESRFLTE